MNAMGARAAKRRRRKPPQAYSHVSSEEERYLMQAIRNSKMDTSMRRDGTDLEVDAAPTFFPTVEDFEGNPLHYIEKIRGVAAQYGICKIVPPQGWNPPFCVDMNSGGRKFQTKLQQLHRLQEGISFGDGEDYSARDYQRQASEQAIAYKNERYKDHDFYAQHVSLNDEDGKPSEVVAKKLMSPENLERDYWDIVETHKQEVSVEYGNDVSTETFGSGFPLSERGRSIGGTKEPEKMHLSEPKFGEPDYYKETWWNLNNIPSAPDSVLRHVKVGINGINVPWMYYGCLFSTFCWHNEDNYLYSVNYHHRGAPKQWYGVPGSKKDSDGLEKVFKSYLSIKMRDDPDLLHHITTMFSPRLLQNNGVKVYKVLQHAREFVVTFPRAFHGGFSLGPNVGEAVNFATHDWIEYGSDANERYRTFARPAVFSHDRLTFTMANHLEEQKTYRSCVQLLKELEKVVEEELRLREDLRRQGVRDVSGMVNLPQNRLDQLDEESADYDDKRLCHGCKHVCFFSAVACECSQSKVSCLRHSHYMCRCPQDRRYLLIWSDAEEMQNTVNKVRSHCESLKTDADRAAEENPTPNQPDVAPGSKEDYENHKNDKLCLGPVTADETYVRKPGTGQLASGQKTLRQKLSMGAPRAAASTPISTSNAGYD